MVCAMDSIRSVMGPEGYLALVGRFTLLMGHLETVACDVSHRIAPGRRVARSLLHGFYDRGGGL